MDDAIVLLERDDIHPIQGVPLDQRTYYHGILRVDVPERKIQQGSTSGPQPLRSPTPEAVAYDVGRVWVSDSLEEREEELAGAPEIPPSRVFRYMPTDNYLQGRPMAPRNFPEVWACVNKQLRPQRLSPETAMMVLWRRSRAISSPWPASTAPRPSCTRQITPQW